MMRGTRFLAAFIALGMAYGGAGALGQSTLDYPRGEIVEYFLDSGEFGNAGDEFELVYSDVVDIEGAAWLRLYFGDLTLPEGSFVRVTSTFDEEYQDLDADRMMEWSDSTAYFNGATLIVELYAAPHTVGNRITVNQVAREIGVLHGPGEAAECGICNGDDRSPSTEDFACRLMPVGCSASVYNTESCMVSAGHCMRSGLVAQFKVPPSYGCYVRHPGLAEQFRIVTYRYVNGGMGNDWAVMTTGTNNVGQKAYERYGELRPLAEVLPTSGTSDVWGYGVSYINCERSLTQQHSPGRIMGRSGTYYTYTNDATSGNSGSGFLQNNQIIGIVTHCNVGGCGNIATRVDRPSFRAAVESLCPAENITCDDLKKHNSKCKRSGVIKGKVKLFTYDWDGSTITVTIDGKDSVKADVRGRKAKYKNFFYDPGPHEVAITRPDCPSFTKKPKCP